MNPEKQPETQVLPDEPVRRLIREELDINILAESAAGTGKTTCLVERIVALVREGRSTLDTLAAVTFTRKAAAELRARVQLALEKALREASEPTARERIDRALSSLDRCFLGTIHAFCARLLRERPVEAGIDPSFEELDEDLDAELKAEAWDRWVALELAGQHAETLESFNRLGLSTEELKPTFAHYADYPDVDIWPLPEGSSEKALRTLSAQIVDYAEHVHGLCSRYPEPIAEGQELPDGFRKLERMYFYMKRNGLTGEMKSVMELLEVLPDKITQKRWPGGKAEGKLEHDLLQRFLKEVSLPSQELWRAHRYGPVMGAYAAARRIYDALRAERGSLNFQDLLMKSAALLRENPHIRSYFRKRFTHILVDEFQDTDPIQSEVLFLLTASDPTERNWRRCQPVPGSLFVVGDPKQSIYRFRRADIRIYNEVRQLLEQSGGRVVQLVSNFRTTENLLDWVNRCFQPEGHGFPLAATDEAPAWVALRKGRIEGFDGPMKGVRVLRVPEDLTTRDKVIAYDAERVARIIRDALDRRLHVPRSEREIGEGIPPEVRPGDFLILTRNTTHLAQYAQALQRYGIPHQVTGSTSLSDVQQLHTLRSCLAAAIEPENPVALLAVLRGELFGFSDPELYRFRKAGGTFNYRYPVPEKLPAAERDRLQEVFQRLKGYASWLDQLPLAAAIERILTDLGLLAAAVAAPGGNVQAGSLLKAIAMLRQRCAATWSRKEALDFLEELLAGSKKQDGLPAAAEDHPAARVMNLHKAKGLEAPIVFLADPTGYKEWDIPIHIARDAVGVTRGYLNILKTEEATYGIRSSCLAHPEPVVWGQVQERERRFLNAEEARLRYVAATRSGAMLIISRRLKGNDKNPWFFFGEFLEGMEEAPDPQVSEVVGLASTPLELSALETELQTTERRFCALVSPSYGTAQAREYAAVIFEPGTQVAQAPLLLGFPSSPVAAMQAEHGVEWGRVVHSLLELAMKQPGADLRQTAELLLREQELDPALALSAVDLVQRVTQSELWMRASRARRRMTEVPFTVLEECLEPGHAPVLVRGVIDLLFEEDDGWVLVDYKTDAVDPSQVQALAAKYAPQLAYYARTFSRLTPFRIKETLLHLVR